jgi:futalosine hydrolase
MRILLVAATDSEIAPLAGSLGPGVRRGERKTAFTFAGHELHVLVAGIGMVATAAWCSRALSEQSYDLALNVGVCGSFDRALQPGDLVHTVSERIVELGAEDGDRFLTLEQLNLVDATDRAYTRPELVNVSPPANAALLELPAVAGITVNTVHGNDRSIAAVRQRFNPQVETMEGAAFMYACMIHAVPFAEVRAVSNLVEKRNRSAWRLPEAIARLGTAVVRIIEAA